MLRVTGLGVVHPGGSRALAAIDFAVDPGALVAVIGPNGAGKSTLFRAIGGQIAHEGSVELCGTDCHHHRDHVVAAYIPQRSAIDLAFPITVGQLVLSGRRAFLRFGRRPNAAHQQAAREALATVGLAGRADASLDALSGGQLQRVLIARALAQEAQLLMLDETLNGVDRDSTEALLDLFDHLRSGGTTVMVATHDLDMVRRRFERCLLLDGGLVADGDPTAVLHHVDATCSVPFGRRS